MSWIFVSSEEFENTPMIISIDSISMVARNPEGGSTIFFVEPERRIRVLTEYVDILSQIDETKKANGDLDSSSFHQHNLNSQ